MTTTTATTNPWTAPTDNFACEWISCVKFDKSISKTNLSGWNHENHSLWMWKILEYISMIYICSILDKLAWARNSNWPVFSNRNFENLVILIHRLIENCMSSRFKRKTHHRTTSKMQNQISAPNYPIYLPLIKTKTKTKITFNKTSFILIN